MILLIVTSKTPFSIQKKEKEIKTIKGINQNTTLVVKSMDSSVSFSKNY